MKKLLDFISRWPNGLLRKANPPTFGGEPVFEVYLEDNLKIKLFPDGTWILME